MQSIRITCTSSRLLDFDRFLTLVRQGAAVLNGRANEMLMCASGYWRSGPSRQVGQACPMHFSECESGLEFERLAEKDFL